MPAPAEPIAASAFSFLRGASRAEELAATAKILGLSAIGVADRNTVAGIVRAHDACRQVGLKLLPGARLAFRDGTPDIVVQPRTRDAWGRLTRLLTLGKRRVPHGDISPAARDLARCFLDLPDLLAHADGQTLILMPGDPAATLQAAQHLPRTAYVAAARRYAPDDAAHLRWLTTLPLKMVATNDVLYHLPDRRPLADVLAATRLQCRVDQAGTALAPNAERHLKSPDELARLFAAHPEALARTIEIAGFCQFSLDDLAYEYPDEPIPPGATPDGHLATLTWAGAADRFPEGVPDKIRATIDKELALIAKLDYARYFLTVHDIVAYARREKILCQGRGSSANSAVCFCLGITAVNPAETDLLFERFISAERREPPDIDVDFEHERREEVIQYIYRRYGRDRAGIAATVIHYRPRSAIREVGKALGLPEDATAALAAESWSSKDELWPADRIAALGLDAADPTLAMTLSLARELVGFPRHLSQHVGGFILTRGRLDETVPIGNAAMDERTFIEWDKDDIDTLGIMKVDVLALGMLTCIRKAFALTGIDDLADIPNEDPAVYAMLTDGDSIGVFQVESRAQINMLPRLRPRTFYDLVIEVAIVRPGPIQGDMVHPFLRRRQGQETVHFPSPHPDHGPPDELERVLGRTLGVPLFQEQAMRIAIEAARFTPEEANQLRRAMATFRHVGTIHSFYAKMVEGMTRRGYDPDFAERCFRQIEGFGTYGFPESHAASFAKLVYVSAWLKCHHPAAFACALLNSQPMGFYAPAQLIRDARDHGVRILRADVNHSLWDCTLEAGALRLGTRLITGFREDWAHSLALAAPYKTFGDVVRVLPRPALEKLADADAFQSLGLDRRAAAWHVRGLRDDASLPLFANLEIVADDPGLPPMPAGEHVVADYQTAGHSLRAHPMRFLRATFAARGAVSCAEALTLPDARLVTLAGIVLVRQRPGNGNVVFITLEDETGHANIVVWASMLDRYRGPVIAASLILLRGRVQRTWAGRTDRSEGKEVVHIVADHLEDETRFLSAIGDETPKIRPARADELPRPRTVRHPRQVRTFGTSRDFH